MSKVWFITGAGRGIGARVAQAALATGDRVVAAARNIDQLKDTFTGADQSRIAFVQLDVTVEASALAAVDAALARFGRIDVVVNNAAYGLMGNFEEVAPADIEQQFTVNVFGVMHVLRAALPVLRRQRAGHVINIASVGGLIGFDGASVYCATKYAVRAISDGLRQEHDNLRVTCIHPGVVESELADTITDAVAAEAMKTYRAIALKPDAIGRAVRFAIEQPDDVDVNEIVVRPTRAQ